MGTYSFEYIYRCKTANPQLNFVECLFRTGLLGLAKTISREVAADGITVNCLLPGYTKTEHLIELGLSNQQLKETIPAKRFGTPEEYAALAVFMSSVPAGYITGQAIAIDGGLILGI